MATEPHPDVAAFLERTEDAPSIRSLPVEEARERQRRNALPPDDYDPEPVGAVEDVVVRGPGHGVPVRLYTPEGDGPFPVLVWAHGGGFVLGDVETEDSTARALANAAECVVASVDYRLAPEHPFPAALKDTYAVLEWASERVDRFGGDPDRIAVGGQSAGANLAAGTSLLARDRGGPEIAHQVLVVPAVSYTAEFPSHAEADEDDDEVWNAENTYLSDPLHGHNPYAYPYEADDFADLPPATVVTAGLDPLRDEGEAYAEALSSAGVPVTHRRYDDVVHVFFTQLGHGEWERAREAVEDVGADLRATLG